LIISTADLFGSFGGSEDFFDGVATLTMVSVLLCLLLFFEVQAIALAFTL